MLSCDVHLLCCLLALQSFLRIFAEVSICVLELCCLFVPLKFRENSFKTVTPVVQSDVTYHSATSLVSLVLGELMTLDRHLPKLCTPFCLK